MIQLQLIPDCLQYTILERGLPHLILNLDHVVLSTCNAEDLVELVGLTAVVGVEVRIAVADRLTEVVDFLLGNGLRIHNIETVEVDNLLDVVVLIDLVEHLPGHVVVYLLQHLLKLVVAYSFVIVWAIFALVILSVSFLLELCSYLFVFLDHRVAF